MYLENRIDKKVLESAGFGPFDKTYELDLRHELRSGKSYTSCTAYISHADHKVNENEINLIVLEAKRQQKDGLHTDWYVGKFEGGEPAELPDGAQIRYFIEKIEKVLHRKNRIPLKSLESRVIEILDRL